MVHTSWRMEQFRGMTQATRPKTFLGIPIFTHPYFTKKRLSHGNQKTRHQISNTHPLLGFLFDVDWADSCYDSTWCSWSLWIAATKTTVELGRWFFDIKDSCVDKWRNGMSPQFFLNFPRRLSDFVLGFQIMKATLGAGIEWICAFLLGSWVWHPLFFRTYIGANLSVGWDYAKRSWFMGTLSA